MAIGAIPKQLHEAREVAHHAVSRSVVICVRVRPVAQRSLMAIQPAKLRHRQKHSTCLNPA